MKNLSDEELFRLVRFDDERAFTVLFDRYKVQVYRQVFRRIQSDADAEEILQNIFISVWKNRKTIVIEQNIFPYLMGAAKNSVFEYYAKTSKAIAHSRILSAIPEPIEYPAEDFIMARELEGLIYLEIQKMPETMRKIFMLSRNQEASVRDIAATLSLSEQTVKNNMTMALKQLRLKLDSKYMIHLLPFVLFLN
ncbi:RNA polymerase sigma factor [Pedobacter sp. MC2016-24]|uniref:RNA polymerase sigma factor n=1 Tax=Pedobacter sp. MC2016-24 TaxID=2780090 RepID=UPI00187E9890|nr:sigma-70 family RNA polymerase sigma factor [Pedobacter sp. MC2016-24]MBE9601588.1 sigma-70 family RNA polymerase sigma factor [Pedobacter sp. MC2016-24]